MEYDIYIANQNQSTVLKLPIIPAELPTLTKTISNEEFNSFDAGTYNFIKRKGLDTFNLECWLPTKEYAFAKSNVKAADVIGLINYALENKEFIQIKIINSEDKFIDDKFSIESWSYGVKKNGDYTYSLGVKQYRETAKNGYLFGWNRNATGWWYCYDYFNYKWYADSWEKIDGEWYYFNGNGYALENQWILWKNNWYYLDENCKMVYDKWLQINGKWYYFYKTGEMACNCTTPDGYVVDSNGAWEG